MTALRGASGLNDACVRRCDVDETVSLDDRDEVVDGVDGTKDGGGCPDADGERQDDDDRRSGVLQQRAKSDANL